MTFHQIIHDQVGQFFSIYSGFSKRTSDLYMVKVAIHIYSLIYYTLTNYLNFSDRIYVAEINIFIIE